MVAVRNRATLHQTHYSQWRRKTKIVIANRAGGDRREFRKFSSLAKFAAENPVYLGYSVQGYFSNATEEEKDKANRILSLASGAIHEWPEKPKTAADWEKFADWVDSLE